MYKRQIDRSVAVLTGLWLYVDRSVAVHFATCGCVLTGLWLSIDRSVAVLTGLWLSIDRSVAVC